MIVPFFIILYYLKHVLSLNIPNESLSSFNSEPVSNSSECDIDIDISSDSDSESIRIIDDTPENELDNPDQAYQYDPVRINAIRRILNFNETDGPSPGPHALSPASQNSYTNNSSVSSISSISFSDNIPGEGQVNSPYSTLSQIYLDTLEEWSSTNISDLSHYESETDNSTENVIEAPKSSQNSNSYNASGSISHNVKQSESSGTDTSSLNDEECKSLHNKDVPNVHENKNITLSHNTAHNFQTSENYTLETNASNKNNQISLIEKKVSNAHDVKNDKDDYHNNYDKFTMDDNFNIHQKRQFINQLNFENYAGINLKPFNDKEIVALHGNRLYPQLSFHDNFDIPQCASTEDLVRLFEQYRSKIDASILNSFKTGTYGSQELQITNVIVHKTNYLDMPIIQWKSIGMHSIGRGTHNIILLYLSTDYEVKVDSYDFNDELSAMDIFQWWNHEENALCTGILIVQDVTITWYHLTDNNELIQMWNWLLHHTVQHINIFKNQDNNSWKLAITHEKEENTAVTIYGLKLWEDWWFEQRLGGTGKVTTLDDGKVIAIIQPDRESIVISEYSDVAKKYLFSQSILSPKVVDISTFTAGGCTFLAVGGEHSVVYQIINEKFIKQTTHQFQLGYVEVWLPIQLDYLSNRAIVIFQQNLNYHTHYVKNIEAMQWNGEYFVLMNRANCISDKNMFGFSCILDIVGQKGLEGATSFLLNNTINLLTTSKEHSPTMFEIKTNLRELPNPIYNDIRHILATKSSLENRMLAQQTKIDQIKNSISMAQNKQNFAQDNWKYTKLYAPTINVQGSLKSFITENTVVKLNGKHWQHPTVDKNSFYIIANRVDKIQNRITNILKKLKNAVKKNYINPPVFNDVKIKGNIRVKGTIKINNAQIDNINGVSVDKVLKNSIKNKYNQSIVFRGEKRIKSLQCKTIHAKNINGIDMINPANNINKPIFVNSDVEFLNHLEVLNNVDLRKFGTVNNISLNSGIYKMNRFDDMANRNVMVFDHIEVKDHNLIDSINGYKFTSEGFENVMEDTYSDKQYSFLQNMQMDIKEVEIEKNIVFDFINGRNWTDFINGVVMANEEFVLDNLNVNGNVFADGDFQMNTLNGLAYPNEYLLANETSNIRITGRKTFVGNVQVSAIDSEGMINGISPRELITLNTNQHLHSITFYDLTITETLDVGGKITGNEVASFLSNPTLVNSRNIKSNTLFQNLTVIGDIIVKNTINNTHLAEIFSDVIMKTDQKIFVNSSKIFLGNLNVLNGVNILSGFINGKNITNFLLKDGYQILEIKDLKGDIRFEYITFNNGIGRQNINSFITSAGTELKNINISNDS